MPDPLPLLTPASPPLSPEQARAAIHALAHPEVPAPLKESFLESLHRKGETAAEIAGFAEALLDLAVQPHLPLADLPGPSLDVCGTGGDRLELFNISTAAMFLLAAGGAIVTKHGNRAITSQCGGADVLETLGVRLELSPDELRECVLQHGLGFLFAPAYHPAFRVIGPVRRALAQRSIPTVFNLLGPLLNPVRPDYQLIGVYDPTRLTAYAEVLARLGRKRAWALHGSGADELTLAGPASVVAVEAGQLSHFQILPADLGLPTAPVEALKGGNRNDNAQRLLAILQGQDTGPCAHAVQLNAAAGFVVCGLAPSLADGLALAREQIANGRALEKLRALQAF